VFIVKFEINKVAAAIRTIRIDPATDEFQIHEAIKKALMACGIGYDHEFKLAQRNRIDFLTHYGVGVEVKKGKPNSSQVLYQIERYIKFPEVKAMILVIERYQDVPEELHGKPCMSIGLNKLWGISSR
jgi:hypothetical protein